MHIYMYSALKVYTVRDHDAYQAFVGVCPTYMVLEKQRLIHAMKDSMC